MVRSSRLTLLACWLLAVSLLASCGGGGGSPAASDPALSVRLGNVRIAQATQRVFEGEALSNIMITADVTGDLAQLNGQTLFVLVEDATALFSGTPRVTIAGNGIDNRVELLAQSTTGRIGSYRQPLRLRVCLDSACTRPIQGSPVELPLQIDVLPGLRFADAAPLVIQLPFGTAPAARSFAVVLPEGMTQIEWDPVPEPRVYGIAATPGSTSSVDLTPVRLPVGTHDAQLTVKGIANLGGRTRLLSATTPVQIRVQSVPGVTGGFYPARLDNQTYSNAGLNSPIDGERQTEVVVADGTRYTALSRIVYLPPVPGGNADAQGLEWLSISVDARSTGSREPVLVTATPRACLELASGGPISCLGPGRYEAEVYLKTADGREFPTPLLVSNQVNP